MVDHGIEHVFESTKSRLVAAGFSLASGLGAIWDILPTVFGLVSTGLAIVVSLVVLHTTMKRSRQETAKHQLEMSMLRVERNRQLREAVFEPGLSDTTNKNK